MPVHSSEPLVVPDLSNLFSLAGKTAFVTGSSRGIGWEIAKTFAAAGGRLLLHDLTNKDIVRRVEELRDAGCEADYVTFDITDPEQAAQTVDIWQRDNCDVDILVSNAGNVLRALLADTSYQEWQDIIQGHLTTAYTLSQVFAPRMSAKKEGRIILISSVMGLMSASFTSAYSAAKGGMNALMRSLAAEFGPHGVTSNTIAPGWILTERTEDLHRDPVRNEAIIGGTALNRWGRPEEVAAMALFLASEAGAYVTGQVMVVDGGLSSTF